MTAAKTVAESPRTMTWQGDAGGYLRMIDQTLLPAEFREIDCRTVEDVWQAIKRLSVRGAPAIGVAASYGVVIGVQQATGGSRADFDAALKETCDYLAQSRPTAVNLFWALERIQKFAAAHADAAPAEMAQMILEEAERIETEDSEMCAAMGRIGAELLNDGDAVLTHCNAGGLATAGDGTALAVFFAAAAAGKQIEVYVDETRPLLQGARLTQWELMQRDIPATLICDSMAGWVMKQGRVQAVVTGADRIAANGDAANKIGTYSVATLAKAHGIPFYVAAPTSTFDMSIADGSQIPIEERAPEEITHGFGKQTAPDGAQVFNPAFDVTDASLIQAIITERGLIQPVTTENVKAVLGGAAANT